jgi:TMEM175 potassium channel family protein
MTKGRLEAFSDGVIAILITIMVLELRPPHEAGWGALSEVKHALFTYVLSFVFLAIYWNNHHHVMQAVSRVNGAMLWANMHLLFWLSLVPFVTGWMNNGFDTSSTAAYGIVLLASAFAFTILVRVTLRLHGPSSPLAQAIGRDRKGNVSLALYVAAIPLALVRPWISIAIYVTVALIWLVPDRRIEKLVS